MKNIIGFYKNYILVEQKGLYYVVNRQEQRILFKGNEDEATKTFIVLSINFINEQIKEKGA